MLAINKTTTDFSSQEYLLAVELLLLSEVHALGYDISSIDHRQFTKGLASFLPTREVIVFQTMLYQYTECREGGNIERRDEKGTCRAAEKEAGRERCTHK